MFPPGGVRYLPVLAGRMDRRPGSARPPGGVAGHRAGRDAPLGARPWPGSPRPSGIGTTWGLLVLVVVTRLIPTGGIWVVADDTLCHKRGAAVAFGGFFLDTVTSSKKRKRSRFGVNWVG